MNSNTATLLLFWIALAASCSPAAQFRQDETICMKVSGTLYTNVGTPVLNVDGKPIPCVPNAK